MSLNDGDKATAAILNAAYASKKIDNTYIGKQDLANLDAISGASILNIQRELNGLSAFTGRVINGAKDAVPTWASNAIGDASNTTKDRADLLTTKAGEHVNLFVKTPIWQPKITKVFGDFSTAGLSLDIEAFELPVRSIIHAIVLKHTIAFTGGAVGSLVFNVGIVTELDKHIIGFNGFQAPGSTIFDCTALMDIFNFAAVQSIRVQAVATGANLDALDQGSLDLYFLTSLLPA